MAGRALVGEAGFAFIASLLAAAEPRGKTHCSTPRWQHGKVG